MNSETFVLIGKIMNAIEDTVRHNEPHGVSSRVMCVEFTKRGMALDVYQEVIAAMVDDGRIAVARDLVRLGPHAHKVEQED